MGKSMREAIIFFVSVSMKFFFLLTPFFALSMFLSMTHTLSEKERRRKAIRVTSAAAILCLTLFFFGQTIFTLFGVTLDAFRVYDLIAVLTKGTPETLSIYAYKVMVGQGNYGYGAVIVLAMFVCVGLIALLYVKVLGAVLIND